MTGKTYGPTQWPSIFFFLTSFKRVGGSRPPEVADPGGAPSMDPHPTRHNSFVFTYTFAEKHQHRTLAPPPRNRVGTTPTPNGKS